MLGVEVTWVGQNRFASQPNRLEVFIVDSPNEFPARPEGDYSEPREWNL